MTSVHQTHTPTPTTDRSNLTRGNKGTLTNKILIFLPEEKYYCYWPWERGGGGGGIIIYW